MNLKLVITSIDRIERRPTLANPYSLRIQASDRMGNAITLERPTDEANSYTIGDDINVTVATSWMAFPAQRCPSTAPRLGDSPYPPEPCVLSAGHDGLHSDGRTPTPMRWTP